MTYGSAGVDKCMLLHHAGTIQGSCTPQTPLCMSTPTAPQPRHGRCRPHGFAFSSVNGTLEYVCSLWVPFCSLEKGVRGPAMLLCVSAARVASLHCPPLSPHCRQRPPVILAPTRVVSHVRGCEPGPVGYICTRAFVEMGVFSSCGQTPRRLTSFFLSRSGGSTSFALPHPF